MKTVIIEDLISTGKSSLQVVDVAKEAGLEVIGMVSIFTYGFETATIACAEAGVRTISLTNYDTLIKLAVEKGIIEEEDQNTLLNWRENPSIWGKNI
jgi:orotate phosphoribosyltransferase